jgi:excisionase family DNA binding protein
LAVAARALGLSAPTLRRQIHSGAIPAHRLGKRLRVNLTEVMKATRLSPTATTPPPTMAGAANLDPSTQEREVKQLVIEKLRDEGEAECGICHEPILEKGLVLSQVFSEKDNQTFWEDPWFVHSECYYEQGWARHKATLGFYYEPLQLHPLLEQLKKRVGLQ